ncbi:MAG: hypothetical protein ACE15D_06525 [Candidatus Eisenbacteria bacterium]|nr:hypothetical protein [Candidatus Eisenbacteria bacterium]
MKRPSAFARDFDAGDNFETFLLSAVATVLAIRAFLHLTGYIRIGGATLHVAHMLWGGLLMLVSLLLLIVFITRRPRRLAVFVGGVGFGMFIDEIGKFVTRDNDYFFRPAVAMIYVVFVLVFVVVRSVLTRRRYTANEYLVNALQEMQNVALDDLDPEEQRRALLYLDHADPESPLVEPLRRSLAGSILVASGTPREWARLREKIRSFYRSVASHRSFNRIVVTFFVVERAWNLLYLSVLLPFAAPRYAEWGRILTFERFVPSPEGWTVLDGAEIGSSALATGLALLGAYSIRRSRVDAFRMFERSILVSLLLTQVFLFYRQRFAALFGFVFHLLVLGAVRYMLQREIAEKDERISAQAVSPPGAARTPGGAREAIRRS